MLTAMKGGGQKHNYNIDFKRFNTKRIEHGRWKRNTAAENDRYDVPRTHRACLPSR